MKQDRPFKDMKQGDMIKLPYSLSIQKYAHVYGDKTGKLFRTRHKQKGTLTITRIL